MDEPKPGVYRHFKGKYYRLLFLAEHTETRETLVIYQALYGERGLWARPLSMWGETVRRDGLEAPRFAYMCETEAELPAEPDA